jgi:hypothetical protein
MQIQEKAELPQHRPFCGETATFCSEQQRRQGEEGSDAAWIPS